MSRYCKECIFWKNCFNLLFHCELTCFYKTSLIINLVFAKQMSSFENRSTKQLVNSVKTNSTWNATKPFFYFFKLWKSALNFLGLCLTNWSQETFSEVFKFWSWFQESKSIFKPIRTKYIQVYQFRRNYTNSERENFVKALCQPTHILLIYFSIPRCTYSSTFKFIASILHFMKIYKLFIPKICRETFQSKSKPFSL